MQIKSNQIKSNQRQENNLSGFASPNRTRDPSLSTYLPISAVPASASYSMKEWFWVFLVFFIGVVLHAFMSAIPR
jgi:hypothetical protein